MRDDPGKRWTTQQEIPHRECREIARWRIVAETNDDRSTFGPHLRLIPRGSHLVPGPGRTGTWDILRHDLARAEYCISACIPVITPANATHERERAAADILVSPERKEIPYR